MLNVHFVTVCSIRRFGRGFRAPSWFPFSWSAALLRLALPCRWLRGVVPALSTRLLIATGNFQKPHFNVCAFAWADKRDLISKLCSHAVFIGFSSPLLTWLAADASRGGEALSACSLRLVLVALRPHLSGSLHVLSGWGGLWHLQSISTLVRFRTAKVGGRVLIAARCRLKR